MNFYNEDLQCNFADVAHSTGTVQAVLKAVKFTVYSLCAIRCYDIEIIYVRSSIVLMNLVQEPLYYLNSQRDL